MWFELFVALRYLRAKRKQTAISVISIISVIGIAAGVMALIVALALTTGFKEEFQSKLLGATSHINVQREDGGGIANYRELVEKVKKVSRVLGAAPAIYDQVFLSGPAGSQGAHVKGMDPRSEKNVSDILRYIVSGNPYDLARTSDVSENRGFQPEGIVLGSELAKNLGVSLGDVVTAISSKGPLSPLGMSPRFKKFKVVAILQSGLWDQDANWAYVSIPAAQKLASLPADQVTVIECKVDDIYDVKKIGTQIKSYLKGMGFTTSDWVDIYKPLFSALKFEKLMMFVTIGLIVLVAASNVIIILTMMVLEKQKDIAILSAMGATEKTITLVFVIQGLLVGLIGTGLGSVIGYAGCRILDRYHLIQLPPEVYSIAYVPFRVGLSDFSLIVLFSILVSFLATIYPARNAARINPVDVLRYE